MSYGYLLRDELIVLANKRVFDKWPVIYLYNIIINFPIDGRIRLWLILCNLRCSRSENVDRYYKIDTLAAKLPKYNSMSKKITPLSLKISFSPGHVYFLEQSKIKVS